MKERNEGGFTFLELMMVLSVVAVMTAIILPLGDKWIQTTSERDAIQALIASIQNMQAYSMANHVVTGMEFPTFRIRVLYLDFRST